MTDELSDKPFGDERRPYEADKPKRQLLRYILICGGLIIALGVGSCVWGMSNLFAVATERQSATTTFIEQMQETGLPARDSGVWADVEGFDEENLSELQSAIDFFGPTESIGETGCMAKTHASVNGRNGTFVMCGTPVTYADTPGRVEMTWHKEGDDWKIYRFFLHYDEINDYFEAKARAKIEAEAASTASANED
ncbi:MAG: hypothetical protein AAFR51_15075 [Pseudomonadota bacterium]